MSFLSSDAPEFQDIRDWINSEERSVEEGTLLLDFWTYSCINCRKMLPMFQKIHEEYPEVTVVGVHTPEFDFEREKENVQKAVEKLGLEYPIALDSDNSTWKAYGNRYWPRQALIHEGEIVWQNIGESSLHELEHKIAEHLDVEKKNLDLSHETPEKEISPETYLGFKRCNGINDEGNFRGEKELSAPGNRKPEKVYLDGKWKQEKEFLEAVEDSKLFFNYRGSEVNLVVNPSEGVRDIEVLLDGEPVSEEDAGKDLRVEEGRSYVRVKNPDMYNLIDSEHRRSELTLLPDKRTRLYAFTFR